MEVLSYISSLHLAQLYEKIGDIEELASGGQVSEKFTKFKGLESDLYWLITLCFLNIFFVLIPSFKQIRPVLCRNVLLKII
jgi:hypothetical protein